MIHHRDRIPGQELSRKEEASRFHVQRMHFLRVGIQARKLRVGRRIPQQNRSQGRRSRAGGRAGGSCHQCAILRLEGALAEIIGSYPYLIHTQARNLRLHLRLARAPQGPHGQYGADSHPEPQDR